MDRIIRRLALWITVIVAVFALYVIIDCIRLKGAEAYTKPFVTISEEHSGGKVTYNGLGYKIVYRISEYNDKCYGAEFYVFDDFMAWGFIE